MKTLKLPVPSPVTSTMPLFERVIPGRKLRLLAVGVHVRSPRKSSSPPSTVCPVTVSLTESTFAPAGREHLLAAESVRISPAARIGEAASGPVAFRVSKRRQGVSTE